MVIYSITLVLLGEDCGLPPPNTPRVLLDNPAAFDLAVDKSPKSRPSPKVANVINSIPFVTAATPLYIYPDLLRLFLW